MTCAIIAVPPTGTTPERIASYLSTGDLERAEVEDALGMLVAADVLERDGDAIRRLGRADDLELLSDKRRRSALEKIAVDFAGAEAVPLDADVWAEAERDFVRERARHRLSIVDALLWGAENPHDLLDVIAGTSDRRAAVGALITHGWDEVQASHLLDSTFGRTTALGVSSLRDERNALLKVIETGEQPEAHPGSS